jgi:exosortase J
MKSSVLQSVPAGVQDPSSVVADSADAPSPAGQNTTMWWCIGVLAALGALGMSPILIALWEIWTDDPLKSIGMLIVPASILLTLRVWRQTGWELRGTWWGFVPAAVALCMSGFRHGFTWTAIVGPFYYNLLSPKVALYLFGSGIVLLFGGFRVWRRAWFPLALLLCSQPVPYFALIHGDLPLQNISAHIARSFAAAIGFPPSNKELLRLMFTPDFGMFIAPGCDGVRGALTLGYIGLVTGYLKRVSIFRWISYVCGGVFLGYLFNLIRLCALVLYYRMSLGHLKLEHFAKWADYIIGGCLFLIASLLFVWVVSREEELRSESTGMSREPGELSASERRLFYWRAAAFAIPVLLFLVPGINALRTHRRSFAAKVREGIITRAQLDALMPKQLGSYTLNRAWQETVNGRIEVESGAYTGRSPDEATLGAWLPSRSHNMHVSWMARGLDPVLRRDRTFVTAQGRPVEFDTAFYSDGIVDSIAGNVFCSPFECRASPIISPTHLAMWFTPDPPDFDSPGKRAVPLFFWIERPHTADPAIHEELTAEARQFLAGVDFGDFSRQFQ